MLGRRSSQSVAAALGVGLAVLVGDPWGARASLSYDVALGAGGLLTDNLHLDPEEGGAEGRAPVQETIFAVSPTLQLGWKGSEDSLQGTYRGQYWTFSGDEVRDPLWLHDLRAELAWRRWSPAFLEAEAVRERIPRYQDSEGQALVDQLDRTSIVLRSGLGWDFSARDRLEMVYRGSREDFSGTDDADRILRHFGEGLLRHQWTPLLGSEVRLSYGSVQRELTEDSTELRVAVSADRRASERLRMSGRLEWRREGFGDLAAGGTSTDQTSSSRTALFASAEVMGDLMRGGSWRLAYEDRLEDAPDGGTLRTGRASAKASLRARLGSELDARVYHEARDFRESGREEESWGPIVLARWVVSPWAAFDLGGSWSSTDVREGDAAEVTDRALRVAAAIVILAGRHLQAELGYGRRENDSTEATRSYSANVFYAWLIWHWGVLEPGTIPESDVTQLISSNRGEAMGR